MRYDQTFTGSALSNSELLFLAGFVSSRMRHEADIQQYVRRPVASELS